MRYNIKALHQHDNGDYWVRINNKELPYVDEDIVLAIKERNKEIERLNNIINELEKYIGIKMNSFGVCNASDIYYKLQELKHKKIYGSVDSEIVYFDELGSDKE